VYYNSRSDEYTLLTGDSIGSTYKYSEFEGSIQLFPISITEYEVNAPRRIKVKL
jgi:hypothetical protein